MALPTTSMSGFVELKDRIHHALSRCQEQPWLDFKESQPWAVLQWRILKTIMGMANLRDGGLIIVGVSERDNKWVLTGIKLSDLESFQNDEIVDQIKKYASPNVRLDVVLHDDEDGNQYLVFHVRQFEDSPVVCCNNSPDAMKKKDRLAKGDFYVRPQSGRPRTERVEDASGLHDLLDLAAEYRARRMLEVGRRIGLVQAAAANEKFDEELFSIQSLPVPVTNFPYWKIVYRPEEYNPELIATHSDCIKLVEKARVQFRGWDFPHLPLSANNVHESLRGSTWVGAWANFMGSIEFWQFFHSGQFVFYAAVREATEPEWREKLERSTQWLKNENERKLRAVPGFFSVINLIYTLTEYFEFAARLAQTELYRGRMSISLTLTGIKGYVLAEDGVHWRRRCVANENELERTWTFSTDAIIADSQAHSLKALVWLFECLGWMNPGVESIKKQQQNLVSGRL
jgi:hypothetical protein